MHIESVNMKKLTNQKITPGILKSKTSAKYGKAKWIIFSEKLLEKGYTLYLYEARKTVSKYITVRKDGREFKVRFSNHKPIKERELWGDCDFFVGLTHLGCTTTQDALLAVERYFNKPKIKVKNLKLNSTKATEGCLDNSLLH